jgi:hypothetical protein
MTVLYLTKLGTTLAGTATRVRGPVLHRVAVLAPAHLTSAALALCAREQV